MSSKIFDFFYFNPRRKKLAIWLMRSPITIKNPIYLKLYNLHTKKMMKEFSSVPRHLMIENTNVCNAACVFCPHKKMKRKKGRMDMNLFRKIVDEASELNIDHIVIQGFGEPLLDADFIDKIRYAKSKGIRRVTTNTNAQFLDEDKAKKIIEAELDEIYISLNATNKKIFSKIQPDCDFDKIESNTKRLVKIRNDKNSNLKIYLSYVKMDENKGTTREFIKKWRSIVDGISIGIITNWGGSIEVPSYGGMRDPCRVIWTNLVVSWNGEVPLCCVDYENMIIIGDLKKDSIIDLWKGKKLKKIRDFHKKREFGKISICKKCDGNYHRKEPWWIIK